MTGCDSQFRNTGLTTAGGIPAPEGLAGCNMPCAGNGSEFCGAGNRLDVYQFGYTGVSSTTTTTRATTVGFQYRTF